MSIKSQKSLNEECSEIIERSYSVRSVSEESLSSCENEEESLARELMGKLTPAVLSQLRRKFRTGAERSRATDIDRRVEEVMRQAAAEEGIEFARPAQAPEDSLWLNEKGFVTAIEGIFGNHKYTTHAHKLFHLLDPFSTGRVRWRQVICRLVAVGARKTRSRAEVWTPMQERGITRMDTCKRETIVKLVCIEKDDSFCYAAVTRGGRVALYSGHMKLLHSYEVFYHRTGIQRRVRNCWITDVLYLESVSNMVNISDTETYCSLTRSLRPHRWDVGLFPKLRKDVQCLILSASDRSLTVYDAATLTHTPIYCITGLPSIPTCMAYSPHPAGHSELALGTERGDLMRVRFLQPRVSLFYTKSPEHINYYFWMELSLPPHAVYCSHSTWRRVHARSVRRVCFARPHIVLSCSHDSLVSVRARHIDEKLQDYVFAVQRGVSCFHVVPSLQLLATGGCDGAVRLWALTQATPFAVLPTPAQAAVLDVAVVASREIIIAFCSNCWLHIWDLYEECLLQTIRLKFPCLGVLGKKVEFGPYCIHPGPARRRYCEEEPSTPDPLPPLISSRRASSVCLGSTGGLMLQDDVAEEPSRRVEDDPEYIRFNRAELLITCCDYICTVALCDEAPGALLPAPGDTLRARRPSFWDLPDDVLAAPAAPPTPPTRSAPAPQYLSPATAEEPADVDLDTLLQNAGLQGLLEKDFVLMHGLKHDLNRKLADMKANMDCITEAVTRGAPHLALRIAEPLVTPQVNDMLQECKRVMKLFPTVSITGTPVGSEASTPRSRKKGSQLLSG